LFAVCRNSSWRTVDNGTWNSDVLQQQQLLCIYNRQPDLRAAASRAVASASAGAGASVVSNNVGRSLRHSYTLRYSSLGNKLHALYPVPIADYSS